MTKLPRISGRAYVSALLKVNFQQKAVGAIHLYCKALTESSLL
jgi:hypothetical protein